MVYADVQKRDLVQLDAAVDLPDEHEGGHESNEARKNEEQVCDDDHVTDEEDEGDGSSVREAVCVVIE